VTFTAGSLPTGVSMPRRDAYVTGTNGTALILNVDQNAPDAIAAPIIVNWSAYGGQQSGTLSGNITIKEETKVFQVPVMIAQGVQGVAEVAMLSSGYYSFKGSVHNGSDFGQDYVYAIQFLDFKDANGSAMTVANQGSVAGGLDVLGSQDDPWQIDKYNPLIADNWDTVKNSRYQGTLHVGIDPGMAIEVIVEVVLTAGAVYLGGSGANCSWGTTSDGALTMECHSEGAVQSDLRVSVVGSGKSDRVPSRQSDRWKSQQAVGAAGGDLRGKKSDVGNATSGPPAARGGKPGRQDGSTGGRGKRSTGRPRRGGRGGR
jgi:hypothetical protein